LRRRLLAKRPASEADPAERTLRSRACPATAGREARRKPKDSGLGGWVRCGLFSKEVIQ